MKHATIVLAVVLALSFGLAAAQQAPVNPLAGQRFRSLEKLPGGETRDGKIVQIFWEINFKDKSFTWLRYDTIVPGNYEFDPKTGAVTINGNRKLEASFDAKTGVLTWDKRKYKNVKSEK